MVEDAFPSIYTRLQERSLALWRHCFTHFRLGPPSLLDGNAARPSYPLLATQCPFADESSIVSATSDTTQSHTSLLRRPRKRASNREKEKRASFIRARIQAGSRNVQASTAPPMSSSTEKTRLQRQTWDLAVIACLCPAARKRSLRTLVRHHFTDCETCKTEDTCHTDRTTHEHHTSRRHQSRVLPRHTFVPSS